MGGKHVPQVKEEVQGRPLYLHIYELSYKWRMPRQVRIDSLGALHYIIGHGIEQRRVFCDDEDRDDFLQWLERCHLA